MEAVENVYMSAAKINMKRKEKRIKKEESMKCKLECIFAYRCMYILTMLK